MIIYKVTNKINNKVYIGQTVSNLQKRKIEHISESKNGNGYYFHRALRKYGIDNFKWQVICICPSMESLNEQEKHYIKFYNTMEEGYNLTSGGLNSKHSEETKEKLRQIALNMSDETKEKMRIAGLNQTNEHRKKNSIANSGKNHPMYGKKHLEKTKKKMSIAQSGKNNPMYGAHWPTVECQYCGQSITINVIKRHENSKRCIEIQNKKGG